MQQQQQQQEVLLLLHAKSEGPGRRPSQKLQGNPIPTPFSAALAAAAAVVVVVASAEVAAVAAAAVAAVAAADVRVVACLLRMGSLVHRLKAFVEEFAAPPSQLLSRNSRQQQQQQQQELFYGLTLAGFAKAVGAELLAFERFLVNEVYIHLTSSVSPLLLLEATNAWRPSLVLLARLCNLDFACSSSSSTRGWRFPRGTALLSRLLKATAALQHGMLPPSPQQQQQQQLQQQLKQHQQQQQQQQQAECALAVRLLKATAPSFLRTLTRCCFAVRV